MDCRRRRLRRPRRMLQQCPGNQLCGLPRCSPAWAPRQGGPSRRAAGSAQPGTAAAGAGEARAAGGVDPVPEPAGGSVAAGAAGGAVGSAGKAASGSAGDVTVALGPKTTVDGGSVAVSPSPTANVDSRCVMGAAAPGPTVALGPTANVAGGSMRTAVVPGLIASVAGGSVKTAMAPGPVAGGSVKTAVAPGSVASVTVRSVMAVARGPTMQVAGRSTAETTVKAAGGSMAVATVAASGSTVKTASESSVAMVPEAKGTNEIIQFPAFGSPVASLLLGDNSGQPVSIVKASSALAFQDPVAAVAATKRHNQSVPVIGTSAVKLLKLPKPDDIHNPALMEALKAVVAAGGSGWLDPAAVAAVRTELEEDLEGGSRETSDKSSEPQQCTWTPSLLVTERRRKKKPVNQERATLVNLVPCTEDRIKEPKHNPLGSEDEAEAYSMEPMLSFSPPESPITTRNMVPGGGNFVQAEPKEIWICGHSVILVTKRRASIHPHGLQLGFPSSSAFLYWHGIQTMLWDQLLPLLHEIYYLRSFPSIIVIHLGENDLVQHTSMSLIVKMKNDLGILRRAFPDAHIIWSSLLPRRFWKGAEKPVNIEKARKGINKEMSHYCSENGIIFLRHDLITYDKPNMFLPDVDDLSDVGADVFTADLKGALHSCLDFGKG